MQSSWWNHASIYQIYPRSYADANNDGVGDLQGIIAKLPHIESLQVDAVWISPIFLSPMKDFGYDVSDYRLIDPLFGTLDEFKRLLESAHQRGIKIIIDQVLNHTSDQHEWFKQSRLKTKNKYTDWYVWADPLADGGPPNNWLSVFGGSSWKWDAGRRQYYFHNFLDSQPDLNFHNKAVQEQLLSDIKFWLDLGVDGLRLDACNFYFHDKLLRSNPPKSIDTELTKAVDPSNPYSFQAHIYDVCRPETVKFHEDVRALLNQYEGRMSIGEIGADDALTLMAEYTSNNDKLCTAYTFDLLTSDFNPKEIRQVVEKVEEKLKDSWPSWALSNHDVKRAISRLGDEVTPESPLILLTLLACLRGSFCIYQGEEFGLPEADIPFEKIQDPYGIPFWPEYKGRDGCRTPMPWISSQANAGFSASPELAIEPWLPMNEVHRQLACDLQEKNKSSVLNQYRHFLKWRGQQDILLTGDITFLQATSSILIFQRSNKMGKMIVVLNLSEKAEVVDINGYGGDPIYLSEITHMPARSSNTQGSVSLAAYDAFFILLAG